MGHLARVMLVLLVLGCGEPKPVVPEPGPGPDDDELAYCPAACTRWVEKGCADPMVCEVQEPGGDCTKTITCEDWCKRVVVEAPAGVVFHPECVATVQPEVEPEDFCFWLDVRCEEWP